MKRFELIAPCYFGTEAVLKKEVISLGYDVTEICDGRVTFLGDGEAVCRANIGLRTAERVMIKIGSFHAESFDELFDGVKKLGWSDFIPENGRFYVAKAAGIRSKLYSASDIQAIVKKAIVTNLSERYHREWFSEDGADFPLRVFILKDEVTIALDTSGESLHKRGYRKLVAKAPLAENLAAALIMLTPWRGERILVDPFCGCGTFPIEAALMAANIAPGIGRDFLAEKWTHLIPSREWSEARSEAREGESKDVETDIQGYDIDEDIVACARKNASLAGVERLIHFQRRGIEELSHAKRGGFIITNPPYGERIGAEENLPEIYRALGERYRSMNAWKLYLITAYEDAVRDLRLKPTKNRKIYNGMMKAYFLHFENEEKRK